MNRNTFSNLSINSSKTKEHVFSDTSAAPIAANKWELSGSTTISGDSFNVLTNAFFSSDKKCNGPPRNATRPLIGFPHAIPDMV